MPRRLRAQRQAQFYEIVLRGSRRKALFATPADRRALNSIAIRSLRRFDATLHAYCLTPLHFRALLQIEGRVIGRALRTVTSAYARHCERSSSFVGPLFEPPHEAHRIVSKRDFLQVLRAIHRTPVTANIAVEPADYRWSSHRAYLGYKSVARITTSFALAFFSRNRNEARAIYRQFVAGEIDSNSIISEADDSLTTNTSTATGSSAKLTGLQLWPLQKSRSILLAMKQKQLSGSRRRHLSIY